jgi:hypothetical protein
VEEDLPKPWDNRETRPLSSDLSGGIVRETKQIVYRYDPDPESEEPDTDRDIGDVAVPAQGNVVTRKGKVWKVVRVIKEEMTGPAALPMYRVFLSDQL